MTTAKRVLALILAVTLMPWMMNIVPASAQAQKPIALTLANLGYRNDLLLQGPQGTNSSWIPLPSNWMITQDVQATIVYTASPVLNPGNSTLSITVDSRPVFSLHPVSDGLPHSINFPIPRTLISGSFSLGFLGTLRVTNLLCEDIDPAQWLKISTQTELDFNASEATTVPTLDKLLNALVVQSPIVAPAPIVFVLPDKWTAPTLSAAVRIAARFGQNVNGIRPTITMIRSSELTAQVKQTANFVIIGKPEEWPAIPSVAGSASNTLATATPGKGVVLTAIPTVVPPTVAPNTGYIKIINSPWNPARNILLISGQTDADFDFAGSTFSSDVRFASLHGQEMSLATIAAIPLTISQSAPWLTDNTTLAQLGQSDRNVSGLGINDIFIDINIPAGWILQPGTQLVLNVAHSPAVAANLSHIAVYANDIYIGTINATPDGQEKQITLDIPRPVTQGSNGNLPSRFFEFKLSVANEWLTNACQGPTNTNIAWTIIAASSYLVTPHKFLPLPDLRAFPYPFLGSQNSAPMVIVIPKSAGDSYVSDALALATRMGEVTAPPVDISLTTSDLATRDKYANANLIVLGSRADQALLGTFSTQIVTIPDASVVAAFKNPDYGVLQEAVSPWNLDRILLMVFSESATGYQNALNGLLGDYPPVAQSGVVALVQAGQAPQVVYRFPTPTPTPGQSSATPTVTVTPTVAH